MLATTLVLAAVAQTSPYSVPEPTRLVVLPVLLQVDRSVTVSEVFRVVSEQTRLRGTLRLASIDEFFFNEGGRRADAVLACGSNIRCVARQLTSFRADLGVVVIVNGQLDPPLVGVITVDVRTEQAIDERYVQVPAPRIMAAIAETLRLHLDKARHPEWGQLRVRVDPRGADIRIAPSPTPWPRIADAYLVPPGAYRILVEKPGFLASETTAMVTGGATADVAVQLESDRPWYGSPWLWVGAAVAVAAATTVTAIVVTRNETTCGCVITEDRPTCPPCP